MHKIYLKILIFILGLAAVLELWGIKIGPIIAGLGLFGVAVALGAQDLFKNLISGILVLVEKRFKIGDWILVEGIIEGIVEKIGFRSTVLRKFDKSLAIIPNFQFAENAVINISETTNWRIDWAITLQYDTTVEQLKKVRNEIESHINENNDFDKSVGVVVGVEKFSDSSIDMRVRCFTASSSFKTWLEVKAKLAIEIKQIVEKNNAAFAFPSQSIYIEKKMIAIFYFLVMTFLKFYSWIVIANVIISWLIAFNVLNTNNAFIYNVLDFTYRLTDPILIKIRGFLPNLGAFDVSPIILLVLIQALKIFMFKYIYPFT